MKTKAFEDNGTSGGSEDVSAQARERLSKDPGRPCVACAHQTLETMRKEKPSKPRGGRQSDFQLLRYQIQMSSVQQKYHEAYNNRNISKRKKYQRKMSLKDKSKYTGQRLFKMAVFKDV